MIEFRLLGAVLLVFLLFGLSSINGKQVYRRELNNLNEQRLIHQAKLRRARVYRQVILQMLRQPTPLSILVSGVGGRYGNIAQLGGKFMVDFPDDPRTQKILTLTPTNLFLSKLLDLDFSQLVLLFFSLLVIFLTHDVICGEREQGLLKLCLSYSVSRHQLLLGEYSGVLISLMLPLVFMMFLWLMILHIPPVVSLSASEVIRLVIIWGLTLFFLSGLIFLGLWISAQARSSATSLAVLLVIWVGLVIVYPNSIPTLARRLAPTYGILDKAFFQSWTPRRSEDTWRRLSTQALVAERLRMLAPSTAYIRAARVMAQTDIGTHIRFVNQARLLNARLMSWQEKKLRRYPGRDVRFEPIPLDISGLPAAEYQPESIAQSLHRIFPDIVLLVIFNLSCWWGALRALNRCPVTE